MSTSSIQVIMLIALQVTATGLLWFLNPIGQGATDTFALYLSVDLLSFAMLSYQYRTRKYDRKPSSLWLAVGYFVLVLLLTSNLTLV
jgi:hypothetical protein